MNGVTRGVGFAPPSSSFPNGLSARPSELSGELDSRPGVVGSGPTIPGCGMSRFQRTDPHCHLVKRQRTLMSYVNNGRRRFFFELRVLPRVNGCDSKDHSGSIVLVLSSGSSIEQCRPEVTLTGTSRWSSPGHPNLSLIAGGNSRYQRNRMQCGELADMHLASKSR